MNERIRQLRNTVGLTQQEFADKIESKRNTITKYETDANTPSATVVSLICREFNVNENWLHNGTGEMFCSQEPSIVNATPFEAMHKTKRKIEIEIDFAGLS